MLVRGGDAKEEIKESHKEGKDDQKEKAGGDGLFVPSQDQKEGGAKVHDPVKGKEDS